MKWLPAILGDVITLKRGHDLPESRRVNGDVPVVSSSGITGHHNVAIAQPPGIVTGRYGTLGEVFFIEEPYWPLNTALYAIDFHGNDPLFCSYFLRTALRRTQSDKAAVPGVNRNDLHKIPVKVPDTDKQKDIAGVLKKYDELIENNRRRIALLERTARLVYEEWFVRFRFPGHEHVKKVNGLPFGWKRPKLGEYAPFRYGKALREDQRLDGDVPVYGSSGRVGKHNKPLVDEPGIIIGRKGNVGAVYFSEAPFWPIDTTYYIDNENVSRFLVYALQRLQFISTDVAVPGLNRDFAHSRELIVPTESILSQYEEKVGPLFSLAKLLERQNTQLQVARDLLLPRLMNGEVEV